MQAMRQFDCQFDALALDDARRLKDEQIARADAGRLAEVGIEVIHGWRWRSEIVHIGDDDRIQPAPRFQTRLSD